MRLQTKTALLLVPIIVAALAVQGWTGFQTIRETSEQRMLEQMSTLLTQVGGQVQSQLRTTSANTELFAGAPSLTQYLLTGDEGERYRIMHLPLMRLFASYQRAYPDYYEIRVILPDGYEDARSTIGKRPNESDEEAGTSYFRELVRQEEDIYTQFIRNPDNGEHVLLVSKRLRIHDESQDPLAEPPKVRGYLLVTESLAFLDRQVQQNYVGRSGHIFFTNGEGEILFHPDTDRVGDRFIDAVGQAGDSASENAPVRKSVIDGGPAYLQTVRLHPDLVLVGVLPERELLAASRHLGKVSSGITLATIVLATLILFGVVRHLLLKPVQRLSEAANQIGHGNLQAPVEVDSQDEVGELAASFRDMAQNLQHTTVSHEYVENVIGSMNDALTVVLPDGNISLVNNATVRMLGYTKDELLGRHFDVLYPSRMRGSIHETFDRLLNGGTNLVFDSTYLDRTEAIVPVSVSWSLMRKGDGQVEAIVCVAKDISERIESEKQLEEAKNAAEAASRAKSDFLAVMSHEIRTPMNGVLGMTELLLDTGLDETQRRFAETARSSANLLLTIINDILDFSKIEAGHLQMESVPMDVRTAVEVVATAFADRVEGKGLKLAVQLAPGFSPSVLGDQVRLEQVLTNLLGNALKFTERGEITIAVETLAETEQRVQVRFSVRDTGIGIDPQKQDHIFKSFAQADSSTTRTYGGTGLGLAICQRLVQLMGGRIGVDSEPGQGSDFWFIIDFEKSIEALAPSAVSDVNPLAGQRVLMIVNDENSQHVVHEALQKRDVVVDVSDDWSGGLQALREASSHGNAYDIAIISEDLSGVDGVTLGKLVKADAGVKTTQLVLLRSTAVGENAPGTGNADFAAAISSPVVVSDLYACLSRVTAPAEQAGESAKAGGDSAVQTEVSILVVEDVEVNIMLADHILTRAGYRVDSARDGREALDAFEQNKYDVVLMDCQMPVMDGFEATRRLRSREAEKGLPRTTVIALTASAVQGDREKCLEAGMDDYLVKPYQHQELKEKVSAWLKRDAMVS